MNSHEFDARVSECGTGTRAISIRARTAGIGECDVECDVIGNAETFSDGPFEAPLKTENEKVSYHVSHPAILVFSGSCLGGCSWCGDVVPHSGRPLSKCRAPPTSGWPRRECTRSRAARLDRRGSTRTALTSENSRVSFQNENPRERERERESLASRTCVVVGRVSRGSQACVGGPGMGRHRAAGRGRER